MAKIRLVLSTLVFLSILSACSLAVDQPAFATSPAQQITVGNPALRTFKVPMIWASLGLSGKLVFVTSGQNGSNAYMRIQALDLATGAGMTIFEAPPNGYIHFESVSPDSKQLVMAYASPPGADLSAHQELYILPLDGSAQPQLLLAPATPDDEYFQPQWSPDGKYVYFSHVNYQRKPILPDQRFPVYEVMRMAYPGGQPEKIADQAYWPRLSADSSRLAYVSLDPLDGKNNLFIANSDGSNPQNLSAISQGIPDVIDAPLFLPDGEAILFSAVVPAQSSAPTWLERLLGVSIASAHTLPSDWWSLPLAGGTPTQLTRINALGLFGSLSPDNRYIASYSGGGIFVMKPDGSESTMLMSDVGGQPGTVNWIP